MGPWSDLAVSKGAIGIQSQAVAPAGLSYFRHSSIWTFSPFLPPHTTALPPENDESVILLCLSVCLYVYNFLDEHYIEHNYSSENSSVRVRTSGTLKVFSLEQGWDGLRASRWSSQPLPWRRQCWAGSSNTVVPSLPRKRAPYETGLSFSSIAMLASLVFFTSVIMTRGQGIIRVVVFDVFSSCWPMRDHMGRSARISNPVRTLSPGGSKGCAVHSFCAPKSNC